MYIRQHPGTVIRELWMEGESLAESARRISVPREELMLILDGRAALTPRVAAKLVAAGSSNVSFGLSLQEAYDQARERQRLKAQTATTPPASEPSGS